MTREKYLIIGAGPCGVLTAARFKKAKIEFDWVEKGFSIGGMWDITRDSAVYQSAHFISSKTRSGFLDFPMPDEYPDYPNHENILDYIRSYSSFHNLNDKVMFGQEVTSIEEQSGGKFTIEFNHQKTSLYRGVIIANGRNWFPNKPTYPGPYSGECIHSFDYKEPSQLKDKNVLIVGAGNSGCEIACDAAKFAKKAFLSQRRGYYYIPKYVFGMPSDVFSHNGPTLPTRIEQGIFQFILNKILVGDVSKFGVPKPDHRILESHPIMNTLVLRYMGHGDLIPKPDIDAYENEYVKFKDGTKEAIDLIIYATGYLQRFPFINPKLLSINKEKPDLFFNMVSKTSENVYLIGYLETDSALYPAACLQADLVTGLIASTQSGNLDNWNKFHNVEKFKNVDLSGRTKYLDTTRHNFYTKSVVYEKKIKKLIKLYTK